MPKDPIVEETRAIRDKIAKAHDYDVAKIARALQQVESKAGLDTVSFPPKRLPASESLKKIG